MLSRQNYRLTHTCRNVLGSDSLRLETSVSQLLLVHRSQRSPSVIHHQNQVNRSQLEEDLTASGENCCVESGLYSMPFRCSTHTTATSIIKRRHVFTAAVTSAPLRSANAGHSISVRSLFVKLSTWRVFSACIPHKTRVFLDVMPDAPGAISCAYSIVAAHMAANVRPWSTSAKSTNHGSRRACMDNGRPSTRVV